MGAVLPLCDPARGHLPLMTLRAASPADIGTRLYSGSSDPSATLLRTGGGHTGRHGVSGDERALRRSHRGAGAVARAAGARRRRRGGGGAGRRGGGGRQDPAGRPARRHRQRAGRAGAARRLRAARRGGPAVRAGHRGAARPGRQAGPGGAGGGRRPGPCRPGPPAPRPRLGRRGGRGRGCWWRWCQPGAAVELLLGVVERLAATAPLLLVMEDLHWADRSTRDLVAFLAVYLRSVRVLLLGFRSDELHRLQPLRGLLGELARNRRVERLELPRFTRAELAEQLAGLLGADPPARLVDDVHARSEGNPFFAEELVVASAGDGAGPGALPPSLREVLLARVVRLGGGTQQVLRVAAAAGRGVTQLLLAAVAGMGEAALLDGLREAVDRQLLLPEPGGDGYLFRHALLAEAVCGELLPGERVRLHTALAGGLRPAPVLESRGRPGRRVWPTTGRQPVTSRGPWAPSPISAKLTPGSLRWQRRFASPGRQATWSICCGRSSTTPTGCWRPAA